MSENDNKNIEKLDDNLDLTTENEEDNSENNPDIDPELTKIDQSLLDENGDYDKIQPINLSNEMQNSFLSYAMSVIVSRALPDVRDGLKPVHLVKPAKQSPTLNSQCKMISFPLQC